MKSWIITLPFLFATGLAVAQDRPEAAAAANEPTVVPAEILTPAEPAAAAPAAKPAKSTKPRAAKHKAKSLPTGDVRHCLDRKTREDIIRCSETARGK
jgi:hypothetical protein